MKLRVNEQQLFNWTCNLLRKSRILCENRQFLKHVDLRGRRHLANLTSQCPESDESDHMADKAVIQEQIKAQGVVVRQLKAEKADKEKVTN